MYLLISVLSEGDQKPFRGIFIRSPKLLTVSGKAQEIARLADGTPVAALAVAHAFPEWMIKKWLDRFGADETIAMCKALNAIPPVTLRANTLKTTPDGLVNAVHQPVSRCKSRDRNELTNRLSVFCCSRFSRLSFVLVACTC